MYSLSNTFESNPNPYPIGSDHRHSINVRLRWDYRRETSVHEIRWLIIWATHLYSCSIILLSFSTDRPFPRRKSCKSSHGLPQNFSTTKAEPRYLSDRNTSRHLNRCNWSSSNTDLTESDMNVCESFCGRSESLDPFQCFVVPTSNPPWPGPILYSIWYTTLAFTSSIDLYPIGSAFVAEVRPITTYQHNALY